MKKHKNILLGLFSKLNIKFYTSLNIDIWDLIVNQSSSQAVKQVELHLYRYFQEVDGD